MPITRLQSAAKIRISLSLFYSFHLFNEKVVIFVSDNILSTLFVGIDISSKHNTVCALDFKGNKLLNLNVFNNRPGAESIDVSKYLGLS